MSKGFGWGLLVGVLLGIAIAEQTGLHFGKAIGILEVLAGWYFWLFVLCILGAGLYGLTQRRRRRGDPGTQGPRMASDWREPQR